MPSLDRALGIYLQLARAAGVRGQSGIRDKLLVLAGVMAVELEQPEVAAECRARILENNPQHLVRRWPGFADALDDEEFLTYLKQQQCRYSPERAEHLVTQLGIEPFGGGEFLVPEHDLMRLLDELDQDDPDVTNVQAVLSNGRIGGPIRPSAHPRGRRYRYDDTTAHLWLVVLLGIVVCAIYIVLALRS